MISREVIQKLRQSREWLTVQKHIVRSIEALDRTADIDGDDRAIAVEVLARKRAVEKLREILEPFVDFKDRPDTAELAKDRAEDAGL